MDTHPGDYIKHNEIEAKTYYLEKNYDWQGLIVDPHPGDYQTGLLTQRKVSLIYSICGSVPPAS